MGLTSGWDSGRSHGLPPHPERIPARNVRGCLAREETAPSDHTCPSPLVKRNAPAPMRRISDDRSIGRPSRIGSREESSFFLGRGSPPRLRRCCTVSPCPMRSTAASCVSASGGVAVDAGERPSAIQLGAARVPLRSHRDKDRFRRSRFAQMSASVTVDR